MKAGDTVFSPTGSPLKIAYTDGNEVFAIDGEGEEHWYPQSDLMIAPVLGSCGSCQKTTSECVCKGQKADAGKTRWSDFPWVLAESAIRSDVWGAIQGLLNIVDYGMRKYSNRPPDNWKQVQDGKNRYFSAALRHLVAWKSGEALDPESGQSHLHHALCNIAFLAELDSEGS